MPIFSPQTSSATRSVLPTKPLGVPLHAMRFAAASTAFAFGPAVDRALLAVVAGSDV